MSETKHTPGPWQIKDRASHFEICCEDFPLAEIYGRSAFGRERCEANARLIAAAPDLLEACELLLLLIQHETNLPESVRNGVTDSTGTVDEGEVKAFEILENARNAVVRARKEPQ